MRNRWGFCALGATCMWAGCSGGGGASGGLELSDVRGDGGLIGQLIVSTSDEPAGDHCAAGGVALASGVDDNGDGALSPTEVSSTRYVCNGGPPAIDAQPGTLVSSKVLEEGDANCPGGGVAISQGVDANRNGKLDAKEVSGTAYACNGDPIELASTCTFPAIWDDTAAACVAKSDWASADLSGQETRARELMRRARRRRAPRACVVATGRTRATARATRPPTSTTCTPRAETTPRLPAWDGVVHA